MSGSGVPVVYVLGLSGSLCLSYRSNYDHLFVSGSLLSVKRSQCGLRPVSPVPGSGGLRRDSLADPRE